MKARLFLFILFIVGGYFYSFAQCPTIDFSLTSTACLNERVLAEDTGLPSINEWDFCSGDFNKPPSARLDYTLSVALGRPGIEFVWDGNLWYGFVTGTWASALYRIRFANGINSTPTSVENLGDLGGTISSPGQVRIIKEGNNWFGLIHNAGSAGGELLKLSFGDKLSNSIAVSTLASGFTNLNSGLAVGRDNIDGWVCVLSSALNQHTIVKLGFDISPPAPANVINSVTVPDQNNLGDVDLINECGEWFGFSTNFGNGNIYRLRFGTQLFSAPAIDKLVGTDVVNGGRLRIVKEGNEFFLLSTSLGGAFYKTSFGSNLNNPSPVISNQGDFSSVLQNGFGLAVAKDNSTWNVSVIDQSTGKVSKVNYSPFCPVVVTDSNPASPIIHYSQSGTFAVNLTKVISDNSVSVSKYITVSTSNAPDIAFTTQYNCSNNDVFFSSFNSSGDLATYSWNFGDSQNSMLPNPSHQYTSAGEYSVQLNVQAENGCQNFTEKTIKIYNPPAASFTFPTGLICTNNEFTLTNSTIDNYDGNLTYEWFVNDLSKSNTRDFKYSFTAGGDQQVKLKASIPGCSDELTQTLFNVQIGPVVDFSFTGKCEDEEIVFTNSSSGSISGNHWDFNNGNTSTEVNPTEIYSSYGNYQVSLNTTGTNGCESKLTKPVTIYSVPQPNFSLDLPPFSCAGSLSQFNDLTPALTDSNITSWSWSFGDAANGMSTQKNPNYTYSTAAEYDVSLQVTSNFGCSSSIEKTITISPFPVAEFASGPACINKPTQFTDASGSEVKAWLWSVNNSSYTTQNPAHTFSTTGTQSVMLTVTANNNCVNQTTKTVVVPVPVVADFTSVSTCAGTTAVFQEINSGGVDPAVAWNWNFAGQANASTSPAQHIFPNTGNFPVTLTSTRQSGCSYSLTKSILISQPPAASFTVSTEAGAAPLTVGFTNTSSFATSFLWKFNDLNNSTSTEFSPAFVFNQLGSYQVELIASNAAGCSDNFTETIQVVVPDINAVLSDFILSSTPDGGKKAKVTIKNKSNITLVNPEVYIDLAGNAVIREKLSGTILPGQSITRMLTVDIIPRDLTYACAEVKVLGDSFQFDNRACLNLTSEPTYLQPYPNPAQSQLFLDWINENQETLQVVIYNSSGQIAMNRKYNLLPGLNQVQVDVNDLATGIYFVSYSDGRIIRSFRFSVAR